LDYNSSYSNAFSLTLVGRNKELSQDSVLSKEVNQPASPINYVLMVIDKIAGAPVDDLALTEAELFIKRLFVQGDYKSYADKFQINRDDLKRILDEASTFLCNKNIPCTIALILKSVGESRDVFVSQTGFGASYIINTQTVRAVNEDGNSIGDVINQSAQPGPLEKPRLFNGTLKKEDTLLLCSESLSAILDRNFIQRIILSSKGTEEICKKLLYSASEAERKDNFSVAAFNGSGTRKNWDKKRLSNKTLLLIIIPVFVILIGLIIYNLSSGTGEKSVDTSKTKAFESSKLPPVIKKDTNVHPPILNTQITAEKDIAKKPEDNIKKAKKEIIKTPRDIVKQHKNVNFIVTGSVVMISNWESVNKEILHINWDNGITDKKRIHKYPDYTSIPSSVKVTYKDNSTKSYKIK
jgi:hypothetical protein